MVTTTTTAMAMTAIAIRSNGMCIVCVFVCDVCMCLISKGNGRARLSESDEPENKRSLRKTQVLIMQITIVTMAWWFSLYIFFIHSFYSCIFETEWKKWLWRKENTKAKIIARRLCEWTIFIKMHFSLWTLRCEWMNE